MRKGTLLTFKTALGRSAAFHAVLLALVLGNISFQAMKPKAIVAKSPDPIQAVAITENELNAELKRLKKLDADKQNQALIQQKKLADEKTRLEEERRLEQKKLADLKAQQLEAQKALERENAKIKAAQLAAEKQKQEKLAKEQVEKAEKLKTEKLKQESLAKAKNEAARKAEELAKKSKEDAAKKASDLAKQQEAAKRLSLEQGQMKEIEKYKLMVQQSIMRSWLIQGSPSPNDATRLYVRLAPSGTVLDVQITTSSGNPALDRSAMAAVYKASPLPVPEDPTLFSSFRELRLTLRPDAIVSEG